MTPLLSDEEAARIEATVFCPPGVDPEHWGTALHEAAHAVVSVVVDHDGDVGCESVTIKSPSDYQLGAAMLPALPEVVADGSFDTQYTDLLMRRMIISAAGQMAEEKVGLSHQWGWGFHCQEGTDFVVKHSDVDQLMHFAGLIVGLDGERVALLVDWAIKDARLLVDRYWTTIVQLARELVQRLTLSRFEVEAIFTGVK